VSEVILSGSPGGEEKRRRVLAVRSQETVGEKGEGMGEEFKLGGGLERDGTLSNMIGKDKKVQIAGSCFTRGEEDHSTTTGKESQNGKHDRKKDDLKGGEKVKTGTKSSKKIEEKSPKKT